MKIFAYAAVLAALPLLHAGPVQAEQESGEILTAFFGLNDAQRIRLRATTACRGFPGRGGDGMPVIFSQEVDGETLDADDFKITTASGETGRVICVTLLPADEPGEQRTALLIGEYGSEDDQPATVEMVGNVMSLDGSVNFKGATASVIPLEAGPTLSFAQIVPPDQWVLGGAGNCPQEGTKIMVRAIWTGGITKPGGDEIDENEMQLYRVTLRQADGRLTTVTPFAVGDLDDNDNNHELCLGTEGEPVSVFFPAGALTDPNEDLNPDTEIAISG